MTLLYFISICDYVGLRIDCKAEWHAVLLAGLEFGWETAAACREIGVIVEYYFCAFLLSLEIEPQKGFELFASCFLLVVSLQDLLNI